MLGWDLAFLIFAWFVCALIALVRVDKGQIPEVLRELARWWGRRGL